jgi:hypothetical protein
MSKLSTLFFLSFFMSIKSQTIIVFNSNSQVSNWSVVDDGVMGGRSQGYFQLNKEGNAEFYGVVSLENNGGFSSIRHQFSLLDVGTFTEVVLIIRGDGKNYQFRIKDKLRNYYSFVTHFKTDGSWQTVKIKLLDMYPAFRGRSLEMDNFSSDTIEEITFLIGNKMEENFKLEIAKIYLQ